MRGGVVAAALLIAACSNIVPTEEGVVSLVLITPQPAEVEEGQTLPLHAVALGENSDTLTVPIVWRALDTTIAVDTSAGLLTGRTAGATGRVIARVGDLYSDQVTYSVLFRADTVIRVAPAADTVEAAESESQDLTVRLEALSGVPGPVTGRRVVYEVIEPAFPNPDDRTVEFQNGSLVQSVTTTSTGTPVPAVRLQRRAGATQPAAAVVEIGAWRPGGAPIPGSGQRFIIRFQAP
jgi:hypothetical protein